MGENKTKIKKDLFRAIRGLKGNSKNRGITLVALVITIIVLLILAGVTIASLSSSGLFSKTEEAKNQSKIAETDENLKLVLMEWAMENAENKIALKDFLDRKVSEGVIDSAEINEEGNINISSNGYLITVDTEGRIVEEIHETGPRPKMEYSLSTTELKQDKVTITVKATIEEGTIKSITKPDNTIAENVNEITYEVTENGNYVFEAKASTGTKNKITVSISNIKIAKPVINVKEIKGKPILTATGVVGTGSANTKVNIVYVDGENFENQYSIDNGTTWKEYVEEITSESNDFTIMARSIEKGNELNSSDIAQYKVKNFTYSIGAEAYDTGTNKDSTAYFASVVNTYSCYISISPEMVGKQVRIKQYCYNNPNYQCKMYFVNDNDSVVGSNTYTIGTDSSAKTYTIPENVTAIKWYVYSTSITGDSVNFRWRLYDISPIN